MSCSDRIISSKKGKRKLLSLEAQDKLTRVKEFLFQIPDRHSLTLLKEGLCGLQCFYVFLISCFIIINLSCYITPKYRVLTNYIFFLECVNTNRMSLVLFASFSSHPLCQRTGKHYERGMVNTESRNITFIPDNPIH